MIVVLADDLTGAAEIGGVAWRHGLRAEIHQVPVPVAALDAAAVDVVVINMNSRSLPPSTSAQRVLHAAQACHLQHIRELFVKVDSVLRGRVLADLASLMAHLDRRRVLLVPANPGLGRTIEDGLYHIDGVQLHATQFAQDPDYPATTADVARLLLERSAGSWDASSAAVVVAEPGATLPAAGVIVGAAHSTADLAAWVAAVDAATIPAGAAEFFAAYLTAGGRAQIPRPVPTTPLSPCLFVCGSAAATARAFCQRAAAAGVPVCSLPDALLGAGARATEHLEEWATVAVDALMRHPVVILAINRPIQPGVAQAARLAELLAAAAARVLSMVEVAEVCVEGGATAVTLLGKLGAPRLQVEAALAPGVVRCRVAGVATLRLTLKPGSYAWPPSIAPA